MTVDMNDVLAADRQAQQLAILTFTAMEKQAQEAGLKNGPFCFLCVSYLAGVALYAGERLMRMAPDDLDFARRIEAAGGYTRLVRELAKPLVEIIEAAQPPSR